MFSIERTLVDLEAGRLITRVEDKVKRGLVGACEKLRSEFLEKTASRTVDSELVFFYNMGSLLQYHYGEFDRGEQICGHIMAVCYSLAAGRRSAEWLGAMLQPYINSARIAAARGDVDRSVDILKKIKLFVDEKEDLRIGDYRLSIDNVSSLAKGPEDMVLVGRNVYLVDSARAFLFANDYEGLLQFLVTLEGDPFYSENGSNKATYLESKARALAGLQKYGDALQVLKEFSQFMKSDRSRIYPAIYTLSADIYWRCGQAAEAVKILLFAEKLIEKAISSASNPRNIVFAYHLYLIAISYLLMNDAEGAVRTGARALQIAEDAGDEMLATKGLMLLLQAGPEHDLTSDQIELWRTKLASRAQTSYYRLEKSLAYVFLSQMKQDETCNPQGPILPCRDLLNEGLGMLNTLKTVYARGLYKELQKEHPIDSSQNPAGKADGEGDVRPRECVSEIIDQTYTMLIGYVPDDGAWAHEACVGTEAVAGTLS